MTKPPRFGDAPNQASSAGRPLPLVTVAMDQITRPASPPSGAATPGAGRVFAGVARNAGNAEPATTVIAGQAMISRSMDVAVPQQQSFGSAPPEIGLTQHHLPDEPPDPRLAMLVDPDSEQAANFRVLRHHMLELGRPQVIVVSSAGPGEGKTTTAANLALALSECGRAKVLLVETHLRRPQLSAVFRFVPPWCFAEQLAAHRHQPMLPWGLVDIPQLWLHVAAINPNIHQNQLLDAPAFAIAMERLRLGGYDHIVIDSPPVLGSADVNLMQDAADGVLLSVRARTTTSRNLRLAIDQLSPAKVLGTVLLEP